MRSLRILAWILGGAAAHFVLIAATCLLLNYRTPSPMDLTQSAP